VCHWALVMLGMWGGGRNGDVSCLGDDLSGMDSGDTDTIDAMCEVTQDDLFGTQGHSLSD